jgi:uncharacterized membrane protein
MSAWKILPLVALLGAVTALGACSTREVAGTAAGGAAGYEYSNKRAMDQLNEDYKAGRINKDEYERQKKEIQDRSLIQ